ncbi:MAG: hypothetical protein C0469_09795 [Cyanobacteria bacterium DS2.3.42]|nr:hypothetical protein [Cyanobacteria bacterium DS2.3.42]
MDRTDHDESILQNVCIAIPCSVDWNTMKGNDEVRLCGGCDKNVYNISAMSKKRAEEVLSGPTLPCLQLSRRDDGTLVTDECPKILRPIRSSWAKLVGSFLSLLAAMSPQLASASDDKAMKHFYLRGRPAAVSTKAGEATSQSTEPPKKNIQMPLPPGMPAFISRPQTAANFWPASISGLGFSKEDLPLNISEKFTQEQIDAIDGKKIQLDSVPPQLDKSAWELFFKARKLHMKASMHFVNKEIGKATKECQESQKLYQLALEQISRGKHDDAFAALVYQEQNKITQMEEQCRQCEIKSSKQK